MQKNKVKRSFSDIYIKNLALISFINFFIFILFRNAFMYIDHIFIFVFSVNLISAFIITLLIFQPKKRGGMQMFNFLLISWGFLAVWLVITVWFLFD